MKIILTFFVFASLNASATITIKPSVTEDLFPCNAGIMHPASTATSCVNQTTGRSCSPSDDTQCVCSSAANGSDYLQVSYEDMSVSMDSSAHYRGSTLESKASQNTFQTLFGESLVWNRRITELRFNFGTEFTGASYFVDFCYLGPVENIQGVGPAKVDLSEGIYILNASLSSSNVPQAMAAKVDFICDLRGRGEATSARPGAQVAPTTTSLEADSSFYSDESPLSANGLSIEQNLNGQKKQVPRFCRLRATFHENAQKVRANGSGNTEMTVYLDIHKD